MTISPAAISDRGVVRDLNEDRYAVISVDDTTVWVVCDGMGGVAGGDLAAQLAVDAIRRTVIRDTGEELLEIVKSSLLEANRVIVLRRQNPAFVNMGTTAVAFGVRDDEVVIANIGDSRAYWFSDTGLRQLTTDHTLVQTLVEHGELKIEDALNHPQAHVLTRCLGASTSPDIDILDMCLNFDGSSGSLLMCTDGLYSLVTDEEISDIMSKNPPETACARLITLAKDRGGFDNITAAIIPVEGRLVTTASLPENYKRRVKKNRNQMPIIIGGNIPFSLKVVWCGVLGILGALSSILIQSSRLLSSIQY